jgi:hypothetical protein
MSEAKKSPASLRSSLRAEQRRRMSRLVRGTIGRVLQLAVLALLVSLNATPALAGSYGSCMYICEILRQNCGLRGGEIDGQCTYIVEDDICDVWGCINMRVDG